jgi:hypothetical protein
MATNQFINTNWVSMEILRLLLNKLVAAEYFSRDWEKDFTKEFAVGSSVKIKFPWRPRVIDGMGYVPQGIERIYTTVNLDQWIQIPFEWDDYERAVKLERSEEELRENYWAPCAAAMAQDMDRRAALWAYQHASNVVGILGTNATTVATAYSARQVLMEQACPPGKKGMLISSSQMNSLGSNITNFFQPADELTKMFKEGALGKLAGFDFFESNSLYSHTSGTWANVVGVSCTGANQQGTSLIITGTNGDTLKKGDKFSIANVNQVNPMTRAIVGPARAKTFTVMDDYTLTGGADTISILPAIYGPASQYQNVDALNINGALLTLWPGSTIVNATPKTGTIGLGLSRFAFMLVGAKLYVPKAVEKAGQATDPETGISVRKVEAWDPVRSMQVNRMDSLLGFGDGYQDNGAVTWAMA